MSSFARALHAPRSRELGLLLIVAAVVAVGFTAVLGARFDRISTTSLWYAGAFLALLGIAHLALRIALPAADPVLMPAAAFLCSLGIIEIYRITPTLARDQAIWLAVGVGGFIGVLMLLPDVAVLERYRYLIGVGSLALLVVTIVSSYATGTVINGARVWIRIGGLQMQPAEFAKVGLVVFFAAYLREKREVLAQRRRRLIGVGLPQLRELLPLLAVLVGGLALLAAMNDFGTSLLFFGVFLTLLYLATARALYVGVGLAAFALGAAVVYTLVPRVGVRVDTWLNPWKDVAGAGYQSVQAIYTIADGGLFGTGLGRGYILNANGSKVVPEVQTDYISAALFSELGFVGAVVLVLCYLLITYRGLRVASLAGDWFSKLLAAGITATFAIQAILILGGVVRVLPLTGITLPFVSYGGSSLISNWLALALLLSISNRESLRVGETAA